MHDLRDLEQRLKNDPKLRDEFLQDPVDSLKKEGIILSPDMEKQLEAHAARIRGLPPEERKRAIEITIGVTIHY